RRYLESRLTRPPRAAGWLPSTPPRVREATGAAKPLLVLRTSLAYAFELKTGPLWDVTQTLWFHAKRNIPYRVLSVFQGLWLWLAVGGIATYLSGRSVVLVGFVATFSAIVLMSLLVLDIDRSLGYAVLLLPVAWQAGGLEQ